MNGYSSGSFTLGIEQTQNGLVVASTTFAAVPSSTSTVALVDIPEVIDMSNLSLLVDNDGDGLFDMDISSKLNDIVFPDLINEDLPKIEKPEPKIVYGGVFFTKAITSELVEPEDKIDESVPDISTTTKYISTTTQTEIIKSNFSKNLIKDEKITKKEPKQNVKQVATVSESISDSLWIKLISFIKKTFLFWKK
jgi:hypothetical protein